MDWHPPQLERPRVFGERRLRPMVWVFTGLGRPPRAFRLAFMAKLPVLQAMDFIPPIGCSSVAPPLSAALSPCIQSQGTLPTRAPPPPPARGSAGIQHPL